MNDIARLFQAFVAPAIFVSAEALLLLSLNVRLMGIVSRLRAYLQNKHTALKEGHTAKAEAYAWPRAGSKIKFRSMSSPIKRGNIFCISATRAFRFRTTGSKTC